MENFGKTLEDLIAKHECQLALSWFRNKQDDC